ncbi:MAG: type VI secretion system tube protein Hcp [Pseudomonadota bacterium]
MAVDFFLKLDGIKGESKDSKHKDTIDILAWSWGMTNSGSAHLGGGAGSGKANVQDLTITKYVDLSSPVLAKLTANGKHIKEGLLTIRKAGENPLEYMKFKLTDILISSYQTGGSGGDDRVTESISLNFAKVEFEYASQKHDGSKDKDEKMMFNAETQEWK